MRSWRSSIISLLGDRNRFAQDSVRTRPNSGWSLRLRLLLSVGLVLLLPACLSVLQGLTSARRDVSDEDARFVAQAQASVLPVENAFATAAQIARMLANLPDIRKVAPTCSAELASAMRGATAIANIARLDVAGRALCAATPSVVGERVVAAQDWHAIYGRDQFVIAGIANSVLLGRPVVLGLLPLRDADGTLIGALGISLDAHRLDAMMRANKLSGDAIQAVFDRAGRMIASSDDKRAATIFATVPSSGGNAESSSVKTLGTNWIRMTAPIPSVNTFVGVAVPSDNILAPAYRRAAIDFALPFLMILSAWIAIWIVTDRQLTRWIIYLRRIAIAYRGGHYSLRPQLGYAPSEFRLLGSALAQMADSIQDRDKSLRESLAQKSVLIKEIHHRVKNNLQIVMSLLSLQSTRLTDKEAQDALKQTRTRINALALVHRILYEIDNETTVDLKPLLEQLADQTREGFAGEHADVRVAVDAIPCEISSDAAVPLALLVAEALTNAFKHAFPDGRSGTIRIDLAEAQPGWLALSVEDDGVGFDFQDAGKSIGARLIKTFGAQVKGTAEIRARSGGGAVVEIRFPDPRLRPRPVEPSDVDRVAERT